MQRLARLPLLLAAVVALLGTGCVVDDGELGGPSVGGSVAMRVGSWEYTTAELEEDVEAWAASPVFLANVVQISDIGEEGRRSSELVTYVMSHRVLTELARQVSGDFTPTSDQVREIVDGIDSSFPDATTGEPLFQDYDDAFRTAIATDFAYQDHLFPSEVNPGVDLDAVDVPEVAVNPRYGSFQDIDRGLGQIIPPEGPRPEPSPLEPAFGA